MIHTLCSNSYLYKVNRYRQQYLLALEKRRALLYCYGISVCVTIATMIWVIYK